MFSGRWEAKPEDDGCYFIDRDPIVFRHVLNYLRGKPPTPGMLSTQELQLLKEDAEFYHLPGLSDFLNSLSFRFVSGPNYTVSSDGLLITKTSTEYKWDMTAITNPIPSSGVHHLKLHIAVCQQFYLKVGVCPSSINQSQKDNHKLCGWDFDYGGGTLWSGPPQSASSRSYLSVQVVNDYVNGGEVGVKMDMTNRQISFTVNGVDRGVAFTDIPVDQSLCFCVLMYNRLDAIRIME